MNAQATAKQCLAEWNQAVAAFRAYFSGQFPTKQLNRAAWARMNEAALAWCDSYRQGIRPASPLATATGH